MTYINAETTLKNLIQKTQQALDEGWIYTEDYQDVLRSAKKSLPNQKEEDFTYPDSSGFHVVRHAK